MSTGKIQIIGAHVAAARELLKITQDDLAEMAGVTRGTINGFENGHHTPYEKTVDAIRNALERRGIEFMNGDKPGVRLDRSKAIVPT